MAHSSAALLFVQLVERLLSAEEAPQALVRWQNERAMYAAELAVMYSSGGSGDSGSSPAGTAGQREGDGEEENEEAMDVSAGPASAQPSGGGSKAAKSRDSTGSRKRKLSLSGDGSDSDTATAQELGGSGSGVAGMAAAPGYVEVCGLELPQRQQPGGSTGSSGPVLVHTPTVGRNLEALALGGWAAGCKGGVCMEEG